MEWYLKVMQDNYANFNGRARRKEYWMWYLFYMIIIIIAAVADNILGLNWSPGGVSIGYGWLYMITALVHLVPGLACGIRRLHDTGKSGWFLLLCLIPLLGPIIIIVFMCIDGDSEENQYGPSPKANIDSV